MRQARGAYRHCGLDPQSRGEAAGKRHDEYLLDTTVAQVRTRFKTVSTGRRVTRVHKTTPTIYPSLIKGEESKARVKQDNTNRTSHMATNYVRLCDNPYLHHAEQLHILKLQPITQLVTFSYTYPKPSSASKLKQKSTAPPSSMSVHSL